MKQKLLLLNDVDDLGKKGEIVEVKAGYARNYLLPQKKALFADAHTLRMQQKLQEERAKQAVVDREEAEKMKEQLANVVLSIHVKVDPEGKMYGSVSQADILDLLKQQGFNLEKKHIPLRKHIKETGIMDLPLRLKEGVEACIKLKIIPEMEQPHTAFEAKQETKEEKKEAKETK
jgi:large subunit ribosomal protein L9